MADKTKYQRGIDDATGTIASEQRIRLKFLATHARAAMGKAEDLLGFMNGKLAHPDDYPKILDPEFLKRARALADAATQAHELAFAIKAAQHTVDHIRENADMGRKA